MLLLWILAEPPSSRSSWPHPWSTALLRSPETNASTAQWHWGHHGLGTVPPPEALTSPFAPSLPLVNRPGFLPPDMKTEALLDLLAHPLSYRLPSACPLPPPGHPACTFCLHSSALGTVLSAPWIPSSLKCYPLACSVCTPHPGPAECSFHSAPWMGLSSIPADPTRASWLPCQPRLPILPSALACAHPRSPHSSHRSPLPPSGLPMSSFTF